MQPLAVTVAQPRTAPGRPARTAQEHARAIRQAPARVVVFPELSLTGYELDAPPVDPDDPVLAPIVAACADTGAVAFAGAPVEEDGRRSIAALHLAGLVHRPDELEEQDARGRRIAAACEAHVAFASFAGPAGAGYGPTAGTSTIWAPGGEVLARASSHAGDVATVVLAPGRVAR